MKSARLNDIRLRYKMVLLYLLIVLPILLISGYFMLQSAQLSFENTQNIAFVAAQQLLRNVSQKCELLYEVSERVLTDGTIRRYVSKNYDKAYESYYAFVASVAPILNVMEFYNDVALEIYSNNPLLLFSPSVNNTLEELYAKPWYRGSGTGAQPFWLVQRQNPYGTMDESIGLYRMLTFSTARANQVNYTMALTVTMAESSFLSLLSEEALAGRRIFVYNEAGEIITTTERDYLFADFASTGLDPLGAEDQPDAQIDWMGQRYLAVQSTIDHEQIGLRQWGVLYMVPMKEIEAKTASLMRYSIVLCSLCLAFSLAAAVFLSQNITRRISRLTHTIRGVGNDQIDRYTRVSGRDEIGVLERNYNAMIDQINVLLEETYQSSLRYHEAQLQKNQVLLEKQEAEITALRGQIHPHYLFNTLETIKMNLLLKRNVEETVEMLNRFADSFRFFIDTSTDIVCLKDELYALRNYIAIQRYVYEDKLRFTAGIADGLLDARLPKLILQPLVENALYHGILPQGGGSISLTIEAEGEQLRILVQDNGAGMDEAAHARVWEALQQQASLEEARGHKVALSNIHRRLTLLYGEGYTMTIDSSVGAGTCVRITIPLQRT